MQANPSVGKDQPPDLACFVPSGSTVLPDPPQPATSSEGRVEIQVSVDNKSTASIDLFMLTLRDRDEPMIFGTQRITTQNY
ncbi:hypothetical protein ACFX1R_045986 [Malus domestica]